MTPRHRQHTAPWRRLLQQLLVGVLAPTLTLALFLVLPLIESMTQQHTEDTLLRTVETTSLPPPPAPPPPAPPPQEPPAEKPPELTEEAPPLDLSQLELALDPGVGDAFAAGDYAIRLDALTQRAAGDAEALFSVADLDQEPRALSQTMPVMSAAVRRKAPGTVQILFAVDVNGRVVNPVVQKSTDPVFEQPALNAIKQWRFEPGKRAGKAVRFRMRVPMTFPKS